MAKTASQIVDRALSLIDEVPTRFDTASSTETSIREQALDILPDVCRDLVKELPWELKRHLAIDGLVGSIAYSGNSYDVNFDTVLTGDMDSYDDGIYGWFYFIGENSHRIYIYSSLSVSPIYTYDPTAQSAYLRGLAIYGNKLYLGDATTHSIHRYSIGADKNLSYDSYSIVVPPEASIFSIGGMTALNGKLYLSNKSTNSIYRWTIDSSGDLLYDNYSFLFEMGPINSALASGGNEMYVTGFNSGSLHTLSINVDGDLFHTDYSISISGEEVWTSGMAVLNNKIYIIGTNKFSVFVYNIIGGIKESSLDVGENQSLYLKQKIVLDAPVDFLELVSIRLSVWAKPVTEYILINGDRYPSQNNPFTRAGKQNPVVAISTSSFGGNARIECFSINDGDAKTVSNFQYVSFDNTPNDLGKTWPDELFDITTKALATQLNIIKGRPEALEIKGQEITNSLEQYS